MKTAIHPTYTHQANVTCTTCGTSFITGSTLDEIKVEVCSHCHPFYTGKQNLVDTAGRVDRFQKLVGRSGSDKTHRSKRTKLAAKKARKVAKASKDEE